MKTSLLKKELIKVSNFKKVLLKIEIAIERKKLGSIIESSSNLSDTVVLEQSEKINILVNQYYDLMNIGKTPSNHDGVFFN